jgi:hypothetical protein
MNLLQPSYNVMTSSKPFAMIAALLRLVAAMALAMPLASGAAEQLRFPTVEAAIDALAAALKANDEVALVAIFGEKHKSLVTSVDAGARAEAAARIATFRAVEQSGEGRGVLLMGDQAWPLPIPLVREGAVWRFATEEGVEEIINRRIGGNERNAIRVTRAYLVAQREYASKDRNGDGVLQYAQKLTSTAGKYDGLYWPADAAKGEETSPFGPLIAESAAYAKGRKQGDPYRGYHFKILTRQGKAAPGGAYNYVINGRLLAGFAMVAYPAQHGESGVMTFIVNHNGKVYQKDLGAATARVASALTAFDPGPGWKELAP